MIKISVIGYDNVSEEELKSALQKILHSLTGFTDFSSEAKRMRRPSSSAAHRIYRAEWKIFLLVQYEIKEADHNKTKQTANRLECLVERLERDMIKLPMVFQCFPLVLPEPNRAELLQAFRERRI